MTAMSAAVEATGFAAVSGAENIFASAHLHPSSRWEEGVWCPGPDSNRHAAHAAADFKSAASTDSATGAPWQAYTKVKRAPFVRRPSGVGLRTSPLRCIGTIHRTQYLLP